MNFEYLDSIDILENKLDYLNKLSNTNLNKQLSKYDINLLIDAMIHYNKIECNNDELKLSNKLISCLGKFYNK